MNTSMNFTRGFSRVIKFIMMMEEIQKTSSEWSLIAENIMFKLAKQDAPFSADDFYKQATSYQMPPSLIKKFVGAMFREFQAAGYVRKRRDYILSSRNGGATLPLWEKAG